MVSHDGSNAAVTVQRFQYGIGWTVTVPADGKDYSKKLAKAKRQAIQTLFELEYRIVGPADMRKPAIRPDIRPAAEGW